MDESKKLEIYQAAVNWLNENGYEAHVRDDYSGRGMFGDKCLAIVTSAPGTKVGAAFHAVIGEIELDEVPDMMAIVPDRSDEMGLQAVYY